MTDDSMEVVEIGARALHVDKLPEISWEEADELWQNDQRGHVRAILTAIEASGRWKIVPVEALRDEARACWEEINKAIPHGDLPGNGTDKVAERNGMILACNIIFDRAYWDREKPQAGGSASPKVTR